MLVNLNIVDYFGKSYIWLFNQDGELYLSKISDKGSSWKLPLPSIMYDIKYTQSLREREERSSRLDLEDILRISYLATSGETWTRELHGSEIN